MLDVKQKSSQLFKFQMKEISLFFLLTLVSSTVRHLQTIHDVIVIGAGAAGIAASVTLKSKNVEHIILEARSKLGGRIASGTLNGVTVDLGASFVHNPLTDNSINTLVESMGWGKIMGNTSQFEYFYQSNVSLTPSDESTVTYLYNQYVTYVGQQLNATGTDTDLLTLWNQFKPTISNYSEPILNGVYFEIYLKGDVNGADLSQVSAKRFLVQRGSGNNDYLPSGGYLSLLTAIYQRYSNATIVYNSVVTNIDYSGSTVTVTISGGQTYSAKKIICSVPLGVLKAGSITFSPALPTAYQQAISSIGFGIFNKILVTLNNQFWTTGKALVELVSSGTFPFPESFVVPDLSNNILMFFMAGNQSKNLNTNSDGVITSTLNSFFTTMGLNSSVSNILITRWENDPYAKGSYSYYKVGTTNADFSQLLTPIDSKVWLVGQHTHPNQSSYVHGAYQTGTWAGQAMSSQSFILVGCVLTCLLLVISL